MHLFFHARTIETFCRSDIGPRKVKWLPLIKAELMSGARVSAGEFVFIETQKSRSFFTLNAQKRVTSHLLVPKSSFLIKPHPRLQNMTSAIAFVSAIN